MLQVTNDMACTEMNRAASEVRDGRKVQRTAVAGPVCGRGELDALDERLAHALKVQAAQAARPPRRAASSAALPVIRATCHIWGRRGAKWV